MELYEEKFPLEYGKQPMRRLALVLLLLIFNVSALELSSLCVSKLINLAVKGTINDFLTLYDIFRTHETNVCGIEIYYTLDTINLVEHKLYYTFYLGTLKHNDYYLKCVVSETSKWIYVCNLIAKPELSVEYVILNSYKGVLVNPLPKLKVKTLRIYKPCPKYSELYKRLLFARAFDLFPIRTPKDPLGRFIVTYVNNEFVDLLEGMGKCDNRVMELARSLYYHVELLSKLGILRDVDKIKRALVPCWTGLQCFLKDFFMDVANFYGIKTDVLGDVVGINVITMLTRLVITITVAIVTIKVIRKVIRSKAMKDFIENFKA